MPSVVPFLRALVELLGSDLHCKVGSPPRVRIDGTPAQAPGAGAGSRGHRGHGSGRSSRPDLAGAVRRSPARRTSRTRCPVSGRFRVNAFRSRGTVGLVFRRVSVGAIPLDDLGVPPAVGQLALEPRGTRARHRARPGSGKTTTLAGMVDLINSSREVHVVTIEDPIEVLHEDKLAMVNQREVGLDTGGFSTALRAAMRQDPDVILVGEMRDEETVRAALAAAETGHFVMSTLHTTDVQETVNRIVDFFPPHEQQQVRVALAGALRGIVAQRLVARADGLGRCCVAEICVVTGRIAEAIVDPEKTRQIMDLVAQGGYYGMQTFDQHLIALVRDGVVTVDAAAAVASKPHDLSVELRRLGLVA